MNDQVGGLEPPGTCERLHACGPAVAGRPEGPCGQSANLSGVDSLVAGSSPADHSARDMGLQGGWQPRCHGSPDPYIFPSAHAVAPAGLR